MPLNGSSRSSTAESLRPINATVSPDDHIAKRETRRGRWLPLAFYATNYLLWVITCIVADADEFLPLAAVPLPALLVYIYRTGRA